MEINLSIKQFGSTLVKKRNLDIRKFPKKSGKGALIFFPNKAIIVLHIPTKFEANRTINTTSRGDRPIICSYEFEWTLNYVLGVRIGDYVKVPGQML